MELSNSNFKMIIVLENPQQQYNPVLRNIQDIVADLKNDLTRLQNELNIKISN